MAANWGREDGVLGQRAWVIRTLEWLFLTRGAPRHLRSDNGPEFIAAKVQKWLEGNGCKAEYITPGSPWESPFIESFNGTLRSECLDAELFLNGREAQAILEDWRQEYNTLRPHGSLGGIPPSRFALELKDRCVPGNHGAAASDELCGAHSRRRLTTSQKTEILRL